MNSNPKFAALPPTRLLRSQAHRIPTFAGMTVGGGAASAVRTVMPAKSFPGQGTCPRCRARNVRRGDACVALGVGLAACGFPGRRMRRPYGASRPRQPQINETVGRVSRRRNPTSNPRVGRRSMSDYAAPIRPTRCRCASFHVKFRPMKNNKLWEVPSKREPMSHETALRAFLQGFPDKGPIPRTLQ